MSTNEALTVAKGDAGPTGTFDPFSMVVASIPEKQKLSLAAFAERHDLPLATLRDRDQR